MDKLNHFYFLRDAPTKVNTPHYQVDRTFNGNKSDSIREACFVIEEDAAAWVVFKNKEVENPTVDVEELARAFHETYERLAPDFGYKTRGESAVPWDIVPERNKNLMRAVCKAMASKLQGGES